MRLFLSICYCCYCCYCRTRNHLTMICFDDGYGYGIQMLSMFISRSESLFVANTPNTLIYFKCSNNTFHLLIFSTGYFTLKNQFFFSCFSFVLFSVLFCYFTFFVNCSEHEYGKIKRHIIRMKSFELQKSYIKCK